MSKSSSRTALQVAITYGCVSVAWILASSWLAHLLPSQVAAQVEYVKGVLFVVVTSVALYALIYAWSSRSSEATRHAEEAERELATVIRTVPVGLLMLDGAQVVTFINPRAVSLLGVRADKALGHPLSDLPGVSASAKSLDVDELLRMGRAAGIGPSTPAGGEPVAYMARSAVLDPAVADKGWVVALADVSEERRQSDRLEDLMKSYRFVSTAIAATSRASNVEQLVESVCDAAVSIGGYRAAIAASVGPMRGETRLLAATGLGEASRAAALEMLANEGPASSTEATFSDPNDLVIRNDLMCETSDPFTDAALAEGLGSSATFAVVTPEGSRISVSLFAGEPGYFDAEQHGLLKVLGQDMIFGIEKLVLDRRRLDAEEALAQSEARYRQMFQANPQVMWVYDADSLRFLEVNDAAIAKYGYSRDRFLAMTIKDIRPPEEVERLATHLAHKPRGFGDAGFWMHTDVSGRTFPVHLRTHSTTWEGHDAVVVQAEEVARVDQ